jgi:hypothetical protein
MVSEPEAEPDAFTLRERLLLLAAFGAFYDLLAARRAASGLPAAADREVLSVASPWGAREALAETVGLWVRRVLAGEPPLELGSSGRERQTARSRVWVCFVDRNGAPLRPVAVSRYWTVLLHAVAGEGRIIATQAVTVGWPSEREARACVAAAGCAWPQRLLQ